MTAVMTALITRRIVTPSETLTSATKNGVITVLIGALDTTAAHSTSKFQEFSVK